MRFDRLDAAGRLLLPWGEQVANFSGVPGWSNLVTRVLILVIFAWALWRALLQFRGGHRRMAALLTVCVLLLLASSLWGTLIDLKRVDSVYVAGFAYIALALFMSLNLGLELRERTLELIQTGNSLRSEIERRRRSDRAIHHLAAGAAAETGDRFFEHLVLELAQLFSAEYTFVAVLDAEHPGSAREIAVCARGSLATGARRNLEHSAWGAAIGYAAVVMPRAARAKHPLDPLLQAWEIESLIAMPLNDAGGAALGVIVVMHRETMDDPARVVEILEIFGARAAAEIQRLNNDADIRRLAYQDHLTGLANRARIQAHLADTLARARRAHTHGALLLVDLDHFKTINDALSHEVGDEVLIEVARRLATLLPELLGRLGGDEFVIVMRELVADSAAAERSGMLTAERVIGLLAAPIVVGGHVLNVRASIGVAPLPHLESSALDILRQAELALYHAKQRGRGRVQSYEAPMQASAAERLELEKGLRSALENNEFQLCYQPQTDEHGAMIGAEVLVRWCHPKLGPIPPSTFIGVAEETGLIHALGSLVLDRACAALARWHAAALPLAGHLSVNVSPWQFTRPDFVEQITETLRRHGVHAHDLIVEITETALLYDVDDAVQKLHALRALGLKVSLDDFGTGYSSLAYLKALPLDELKIDRSFVNDLTVGSNTGLVQSMVAVGRHMGLVVIAEGVETAAQRDLLVEIGCHRFQGYFFSRPLPEAEFVQWMSERGAALVGHVAPAIR
jgi:diguanylate cyclase (GGDEF)-like protein